MDSSSTYYAVGLISLIVATLLFIMYINVINMDLAMDEKEEDKNEDSSVQYITMDDSFYRDRGHNGKHRRRDDKRDYDWDYDERHEKDNLVGKDGAGQRKIIDTNKKPNWHPYGEGAHPGGAKGTSAEGFLPALNDLTVKQKLQTGAENIRNTLK